MQEPFVGQKCDNCHLGVYRLPDNGQEWHVKCDECNAVMMCYVPLPHQAKFHADNHKYKMFAGGYGSGKTTTGAFETINHILSTAGGTTLIGAETLPQLEQTAMKEFFEIFPAEFITHYNRQKNYLDVFNGHRVIFRPLDEEQKARSLNLTFFWIEESNGVDFSYFTQLQTRLRNTATPFQRGILTTNPDMGWIKTEFLLKAHKIYNSPIEYVRNEVNKNFSVHIAPTELNTHLPPNYFEDTAAGKPEWWINRYLKGSFENREGLVYPMYSDHIVPAFEIPPHWERRIGGDFGLNNPTGFLFLATDPETGTTYVYDEHKEAQKPVSYHAEIYHKKMEKIPYGVVRDVVGDAAGQQRSTVDMRSVFDHYAEYGIYWTPSTKKLEDSILKLYSYFTTGRLKIFDTCTEIIEELSQYRYPERSIDKGTTDEKKYERPIAVNDHLVDALRYIVAELPDNPDDLINKSYNAQYTIHNRLLQSQNHLPHALQDNEESYSYTYSRSDAWMAY